MRSKTRSVLLILTNSIIIAMSSCSCSYFEDGRNTVTPMDAHRDYTVVEAENYITEELNIAPSTSIFLSLDMEEYEAGICRTKGNDRVILLNSNLWYPLSKIGKITLILHEIMHCDYDIMHSEEEDTLMNPYLEESIDCVAKKGFDGCLAELGM